MLKIGRDATVADSCPLCGDQSGNPNTSGILRLYGEDALHSSVLWESKELYLTPGPGTLMRGYLIVATKAHLPNFSQLSDASLSEMFDLRKSVSAVGAANGLSPYLMFEHGSGHGYAKGASCVEHAHMHLAPCRQPDDIRKEMEASFPRLPVCNPSDIKTLDTGSPYVFLYYDNRVFAYETIHIRCQFVRRLLAIEAGVPEQWNWFEHPFPDNFWSTRAIFEGQLGSLAGTFPTVNESQPERRSVNGVNAPRQVSRA